MTRILIVDDNDENLYYLRALLSGNGCSVVSARNGAEALALARESPPDLVISDLLMPVMDGYTLLRHWKADAELRHAPFIVYTATYTEPEDEELALELGADAFILKPMEPGEFLTRIEAVRARVIGADPTHPEDLGNDETELLKNYSETLIRKLEKRSLQLEEANRALQKDIAERTVAEKKLRDSEERFREIAETIKEVFWVSDPSRTRILYVSPAYQTVWGRSPTSLYESPRGWIDTIHPEDRERFERADRTRQARGTFDETYRILQPEGTVRWVRDRAFPVPGASGEVLRVVGTAEDVTERRVLEEQFRKAQRMEAIGQLAAGVAHDFNNLLAAIRGNTRMALADTAEGHPARSSLAEIDKAGARASSLVQQILTFSRQHSPERRVVELGPIIREAIGFLRAAIPSTVELNLEIDPSALPVLADPTQMHQVIANLCANAVHAMDERSGRIEVKLDGIEISATDATRVAGLRPGKYARLAVADTGCGMSPTVLQRLFEPFFTTKQPGKGTGLGLAVVHGIVQAHDGAIAVTSQPGFGSTFELYFPGVAADAAEAVTAAVSPPKGSGERILLLDDEEALVDLGVRLLERHGFRVTGFVRPEEAVARFADDPSQFDVVVTDMSMGGTSGLDVAARMLAIRPGLLIVLCSGYVTEELREQARSIGIREVLYKPNTMGEFGEAIARLLAAFRDR